MGLNKYPKHQGWFGRNWLKLFNLRPEESGRTFLMFLFYTLSSVGILWLEVSAATLFLKEYGSSSLPFIYMASAGMGVGLGVFYSWLQKILPLHRVIVLTAVLMALPLILFRLGLNSAILAGYTVFLMRLWLEAVHIINELNTSITANQLFTIREIKRTYPLVSSGILMADVLSGLSLPLLRSWMGLPNVIVMACLMLLIGSAILFYLTHAYRPFFPDASRRRTLEKSNTAGKRRLQGALQQYLGAVIVVFCAIQVLAVLLDFQYLSQLELALNVQSDRVADFLALFSALLGLFELAMQWFVSGRVIENLGVFRIALLPPALIAILSFLTLTKLLPIFWGTIALRFVDELLRYTLVASTGPVLFQPLPEGDRSRIQSIVHGITEPLTAGLTGTGILATLWVFENAPNSSLTAVSKTENLVFLFYTTFAALLWLGSLWFLHFQYLNVLVMTSRQGQLGLVDVDFRSFRRSLVETLNRATTELEQKTCVEILLQSDPRNAGEVLLPLIKRFSPVLQRQSLEVMLQHPNPVYLPQVRQLVHEDANRPFFPEVSAAAWRLICAIETNPQTQQLRRYFAPNTDPVLRGTAASLVLRWGEPSEKAEATAILRRMLTHKRERERVMGCRALGDAAYLQSLRLYIEPLLQDESVRVRCAMLEAIAATQQEEYYPSLIRGLLFKSTREAAKRSLIRLENEALPLLIELAEDPYRAEGIKTQVWQTIGKIGTPQALDVLVRHLYTAWGSQRASLLRILVKLPREIGIDAVADSLGRSGLEAMMTQELRFLAHLYAALSDLTPERTDGNAGDLLRRSLHHAQRDTVDRLFLLMRFLYEAGKIQAAAFNLQSHSRDSIAQGLEILDNTLDIPHKTAFLNLLELESSDRATDEEKLQTLSDLLRYQPLSASQRLRELVDLRHFLPAWTLTCCFHLARQAHWNLTAEHTVACLRHPTGYVREAVLAYLQVVSPSILSEVLPALQQDPDRLVAAQVRQMMAELGINSTAVPSVKRPVPC